MGLFETLRKMFAAPDVEPALPPRAASAPAAPARPAFDYGDARIPTGAREKIAGVLASLDAVETMMDREQVQAVSRTEIELMRGEHLPKLVKSYIDIPPAHRAEIFRTTGKSASFILEESLDAMQGRIDEIARNLAQHDLDAFASNAAFISRRYRDNDPFR
ncbi:hypothetical protein [Porphyrobacter sp. YT40]|uniref:hypothetical protein n=1 Tax=Porphyrobacter sp. YT40 TaxID=2547601 RepID=UPI001144AD4C|nr:hypothetical protein [Porphyrobacter sp. YT40]QDH33811.1 hypothetical protein E2E27_05365 [Porphyrobacter sp. YT40]